MVASQKTKYLRSNAYCIIISQEAGLLAGILFTLAAFIMGVSGITLPEPYVQLPTTYFPSGCILTESEFYSITISKDSNIFFAIENKQYQAFTVRAVAARHGIHLTTKQLQDLQKLPYMGMDVCRLPEYFASSRTNRYAIMKSGIPAKQLAEYIDEARKIYLTQLGKPILCRVRADEQLSFAQFKQITAILQQRNINRLKLDTYGQTRPSGTI